MFKTFINRKLADLGCRFDMRSKGKKGAEKDFNTLLYGTRRCDVINKVTKELILETLSMIKPAKSLSQTTQQAVRNVAMEFRKYNETRNVDLRDMFPDVIVKAIDIDETVRK